MNKKSIQRAAEYIANARTWLDAAMYSSPDAVTDAQHARIREAYDHLCQASDALFNLPS